MTKNIPFSADPRDHETRATSRGLGGAIRLAGGGGRSGTMHNDTTISVNHPPAKVGAC